MSRQTLQSQAAEPAWIERLYDRVVDGAWRIAMRATGDEALATELVEQSFHEHLVECGGDDDVCVLRHLLARTNAFRSADLRIDADRRSSLDIRDAFELVFVGGARLEDVAAALECTAAELSRRLLDAARGPAEAISPV